MQSIDRETEQRGSETGGERPQDTTGKKDGGKAGGVEKAER